RNVASRWLYRSATARVVTTGEQLRRQVIEENGADAARVVSIPTGIDLDHFRPGDRADARAALDLPADDAVIGIVATLRDWKGHHDLLRAVASLSPSPLGDEACPGNPLAGGRGERHPLL